MQCYIYVVLRTGTSQPKISPQLARAFEVSDAILATRCVAIKHYLFRNLDVETALPTVTMSLYASFEKRD